MNNLVFRCPQVNLFGKGCLSGLTDLVAGKFKKALLVTDGGIAKLELHKPVVAALEKAGIDYVIYSEVKPNPSVKNVNAAFAMFQQNACDLLVSVGGGSAIDCAKAVSILAANGGDIFDYIRDEKPTKGAIPHIAVATTAGTASEATHSYVISDEEAHFKYGVRDGNSLPAISVNDADLLLGLPKSLTAATGMDALTHAVESFIGNRQSYLTQELALSAIRMIFEWLPVVCREPANVEARERMSTAQYLAGLAFGNTGVGLVHCMSHQLSAVYDTPHGIANAALLPHCLRFEKQACLPALARIGRMTWPLEAHDLGEDAAAQLVIDKIAALSHEVDTDPALSELGVKETDIPLLSAQTLQDGSIGNSVLQPTAEEVAEVFRGAL